MLNSVTSIFSLAAILILSSVGVSAETKIGFVDTAKLLESAPQAKAAQSSIEAEFAPRDKELLALQKEIQKMADRLVRDGSVMSESERTKLERKILSKRRELKRVNQEFKEDFSIRSNELTVKLYKDIDIAIKQFAKEKSYDLIVTQGVLYASDKVDITESVLKKLSEK